MTTSLFNAESRRDPVTSLCAAAFGTCFELAAHPPQMPHFCAAISLSEAPKRYVTTSLFEHITKAESQRSPLCSSKLCSRFVFDVTLFRRINLTFSRKVLTFRSGYSVKDSSSPDKTSPCLPYLRRNLTFARKDITLPAAMGPKVLFVMCKSSKASLPQVPAFESVA